MSATVTYKGATLTTVNNETKVLNTAGTWVEGDITITDVASGITPTGTLNITTNGTHDVTQYASASVAVPTGVDIPVFTATYDSTGTTVQSITCNKTYAQCYEMLETNEKTTAAALHCVAQGDSTVYEFSVSYVGYIGGSPTGLMWTVFSSGGNSGYLPIWDILYASTGTITLQEPSRYTLTLNASTNGTYTPDYGVYTEVNVNVPTGTARTSADLTVSGATVNVPAGLYSEAASKTVASGTEGTPTATKSTVSNNSVSVTPSVTNSAGYIAGGTHNGTAVTVTASELVSGTKSITANGTGIDVTNYASVDVAVPTPAPTLQSKTATPTESAQTITADSGYDGLSSVEVGAISAMYVGSGIARRTIDTGLEINNTSGVATVYSGYWANHPQGGSQYKQLDTQAAVTVTPSKSQQTVGGAGKFMTGAVTVAAIPAEYITTTDATAAASDIISGETAYVNGSKVTGTLTFNTIYSGSSDPSSSTGSNGDIYIKTS